MGTVYELAPKYVADGAMAVRGGRIFVAFKPSGSQRNALFEVKRTATGVQLVSIGMTPGTYYKDGGCALAFDDVTGELLMFNTCSPNPATGADARPVLWMTGIKVAPASGTALTQAQLDKVRLTLS